MCDALYHLNQALKYWSKLHTEYLKSFYGHSALQKWSDNLTDSVVDNQLQTFNFLNTFFRSK